MKEMERPNAIVMFVRAPADPLTSAGAVSIINFGPKTQFAPPAKPNMKTPIENTRIS